MFQVARTIQGLDEEVKHRTVVPDVHRRDVPFAGDVRFDPPHLRLPRAETLLRPRQGRPGDVEHGHAFH